MPSRFTITEKWQDGWYRKLSVEAKVLFQYLCDNCDIAGFWEIDLEVAAVKTGIPFDEKGLLENCRTHYKDISTVLQELSKCYLCNEKYIWIKNFIYYQGNLPLHKNCNTNIGIIKCINSHNSLKDRALKYLEQQEADKGCLGVAEGLGNLPSNSKGNGNSNKGIVKGKFKPPAIDEIKKYIQENPELSNIDPIDFFKGYNDSGWIDTQGKPIRNWKLKLRTRSNCAKERGGNKTTKPQALKSNKCFVCKSPATKLVDTGGGKDLLCDDCHKAYKDMPDFRDWKKRMIPKAKCDRGTLEKMILEQKAKRNE